MTGGRPSSDIRKISPLVWMISASTTNQNAVRRSQSQPGRIEPDTRARRARPAGRCSSR